MIRLSATVTFTPDAFRAGPLPNPSRSLLLGDPSGGRSVHGCLLTLLGVAVISAGAHGPAHLDLFADIAPDLTVPIPLLYGRIVGQATRFSYVGPTPTFGTDRSD